MTIANSCKTLILAGAGHPGEQDIGGLILVSPPALDTTDVFLTGHSWHELRRTCRSRTLRRAVSQMAEGWLLL